MCRAASLLPPRCASCVSTFRNMVVLIVTTPVGLAALYQMVAVLPLCLLTNTGCRRGGVMQSHMQRDMHVQLRN